MLEASDRTSVADALLPPPGYVLGAGLGTAFSLEFPALVAMLLALAGAEIEVGEAPDPAAVVPAVRRLGGRLRVFVNRSSISPELARQSPRLVALLDGIVRDVAVPDASFHPKVWLLRYDPAATLEVRGAPSVYRLICASRNLTTSRCWELAARVEGVAGPRETSFGRSVAAFAVSVLGTDRQTPRPFRQFAEAVRHVEFEAGRLGREQLEFLWQAPGRGALLDHVPARGGRALLLAPFVRPRFLQELVRRFDEVWLAGRAEELAALGAVLEAPALRGRVFAVEAREVEELGALDLHAKLLLCETAGGARTLIGSANASAKAWGISRTRNWEAVLALAPGVDLDDFRHAFLVGKDGVPHPWIVPFRPEDTAPITLDPAEVALDLGRGVVAALPISGAYDHAARRLTLALPADVAVDLPTGVLAEIAPLLLQGHAGAFHPLRDLIGGTTWAPVDLVDVCDFAVARLRTPREPGTSSATVAEETFVLRVAFELGAALREARDDALSADLLRDTDPLAVLWHLLWGVALPAPPGGGKRQPGSHAGADLGGGLLGEVTLERLLEACTESPDRMDEVDAMLRVFRGRSDLDSALLDAWAALKAAHATVAAEDR